MNHMSQAFTTNKLASIEQFFSEDVEAYTQSLRQLDFEIDENAVPRRGDQFHQRLQAALAESLRSCRLFEEEYGDDPELLRDVQEAFLRETHQWYSRSWLANRARTKPSGFAGDYEMLCKLYEKSTSSRGLGGYLDLCFIDLPLAQAVRTRLESLRGFLIREIEARDGEVRILDIASGPCREYQDWPSFSADRKIEIVAMDSDPLAIEYVQSHVRLNGASELRAVHYNALRTRSAAANKKKFGTFDIIYSVGLCDYLADKHLIGMLSAWRQTLKPDGVVYVAFKDSERYDKTFYQWHADWFFYQRTQQETLRLFELAGFDIDQMQMTRDETGIIINFIERRTDDALVRFDEAQQQPAALSERSGNRVQV